MIFVHCVTQKNDTTEKNSIINFEVHTLLMRKSSIPSKPLLFSFLSSFFYRIMDHFFNANGERVERTRCEIYTRVMGYYRPVSQFNNGKKSEFYSRSYFKTQTCSSLDSKSSHS